MVRHAVSAVVGHDLGLVRYVGLSLLLRAQLREKTGRTGENTELLLGGGRVLGRRLGVLRATLRAGVEVAEERGGGGGGARGGRRRQVGVE